MYGFYRFSALEKFLFRMISSVENDFVTTFFYRKNYANTYYLGKTEFGHIPMWYFFYLMYQAQRVDYIEWK